MVSRSVVRPYLSATVVAVSIAAIPFIVASAEGWQGGGRGAAQAAPRGRSVTLGDLTAFDVKDNTFNIAAGPDQLRVMFYRDDIFRIWLGPDGQFTDAQPAPDDAQIVVFKGPAIAMPWKDAGEYYRIVTKASVLRVYKRPLRFALFDANNV